MVGFQDGDALPFLSVPQFGGPARGSQDKPLLLGEMLPAAQIPYRSDLPVSLLASRQLGLTDKGRIKGGQIEGDQVAKPRNQQDDATQETAKDASGNY